MRDCIPNELFNRIPYPLTGTSLASLDGIYRSIAYKLPKAEEVEVRREIWHALCDFCGRTGALLEKFKGAEGATSVSLFSVQDSELGWDFLRVVGAQIETVTEGETVTVAVPETGFSLASSGGVLNANFQTGEDGAIDGKPVIIASMQPKFSDVTLNGNGVWKPEVPQYFLDRYGECVAHGALARLHAMRGEGAMARMHATAYNNDLNRLSFGLITSGMRKHLLIDVEDWLVNTSANGNG